MVIVYENDIKIEEKPIQQSLRVSKKRLFFSGDFLTDNFEIISTNTISISITMSCRLEYSKFNSLRTISISKILGTLEIEEIDPYHHVRSKYVLFPNITI